MHISLALQLLYLLEEPQQNLLSSFKTRSTEKGSLFYTMYLVTTKEH